MDGDREVIAPLTQGNERRTAALQPSGWSDWAVPGLVVERLSRSSRLAAVKAAGIDFPGQVVVCAIAGRLTSSVRAAIAQVETRPEALTLFYMSPEFQRQ